MSRVSQKIKYGTVGTSSLLTVISFCCENTEIMQHECLYYLKRKNRNFALLVYCLYEFIVKA